MRIDGRQNNQIRPVRITPNPVRYAEGSVLIESGNTRVICTATVDTQIPKWLKGENKGWVTAEYGMLPRSTHTRIRRDRAMNSGRTQEISRLIGRSLRSAVDLGGLGERQIIVDCDVLQADGGTRTAAITGSFVALALALKNLVDAKELETVPLLHYISAISVGMHKETALLDLCYEEDVEVETDMNFVMTSSGDFVEIQGTAEGQPFSKKNMDDMADLAKMGCDELFEIQSQIMDDIFALIKD